MVQPPNKLPLAAEQGCCQAASGSRVLDPPMDVFVYEYTCATNPGSPLQGEGWAMLCAVLDDFNRVPAVRTLTMLHAAGPRQLRAGELHRIQTSEECAVFRKLAAAAAWTLVIAPEFDDLLLTRCRWVEEAGGRLLGPAPEAVGLTGDKLLLARHLQHHAVPTPPTEPLSRHPSFPFPLIHKPRFGAGSQATFLAGNAEELAAGSATARGEGWQGEAVVQPFAEGAAGSVAFLLGPAQELALTPARQHLSGDGRFRYLGGELPLRPDQAERAVQLAQRAVRVVPGLRGYVGVDLVLGEQDWVMEINPRLTTSYVGLRALAEANLAETMVRVVSGESVPPLTWRRGSVRFTAEGTVAADLVLSDAPRRL
jgi:predicted ATP-grasp superfamily ATP-dependent carboligase